MFFVVVYLEVAGVRVRSGRDGRHRSDARQRRTPRLRMLTSFFRLHNGTLLEKASGPGEPEGGGVKSRRRRLIPPAADP